MNDWVTPKQAAELDGISRMEVSNRKASGEYASKNRDDGKPGYFIYVGSLKRQDRVQASRLSAAMESYTHSATSVIDNSIQMSLIPGVDPNAQRLAALGVPPEQTDRVFAEFVQMQPFWNGDRTVLHKSFGALEKEIGAGLGLHPRTVQRRRKKYTETKSLQAFVHKKRGPKPGERTTITLDFETLIKKCRIAGNTEAQIIRAVQEYSRVKAECPEWRVNHSDKPPGRTAIRGVLKRLDALANAAREGQDAVKTACGHIPRSYSDLESLERVESDEVKLNVLSFDPRRPVNRRGEPWIRRYWLLTFYDTRAMYPLVWHLCEGSEYELRHGIAVEDEINLFVALIRQFGIPDAIHSDRGRFRGRDWGGEPYQQRIDKEFAPANGILQRVGQLAGLPDGIRHDMPRVHNPRGTRLERFHRWVADWFRGKPGWIGANTKERKMTHGDAEAERHKLWCVGKLARGERSPLMTRDEIWGEVNRMMEAWRAHNSEGTDMCGMTPHAVFTQCAPASGFRQISEEQLAFATAQHFENQLIREGGVIALRDVEYFHASLTPLAGQKHEVVRLRHDHSFITVLPAQKGQPEIIAPRGVPVGMKNKEELSRRMELHNRIAKIAGEAVKPLEYDPGAQFPDTTPAQVIRPAEFFATQDAPPVEPEHPETSSVEFLMEHDRYATRVKAWDFADLEK